MPIVKTTVTGPILDVTGTAYTKAVVRFTPRGVGGDDAADTVLAQTPVEVMPDASTGAFSIDLAPSDTIAYDVVLAQFLPDRERVYKIGAIYVPSTGPVALEDLLPVFDPSLPTNAELLAALSAAVAEAEAAADRAEAAGNSFATIAALAAADTLEDGLVYAVDDGDNGQREYFEYDADSTTTADGALIVDATGMGVGRLISQRTEYADFAEFDADVRPLTAGTALFIQNLGWYDVASTGENFITTGGIKVRVRELPWGGVVLEQFGPVVSGENHTSLLTAARGVSSHIQLKAGVTYSFQNYVIPANTILSCEGAEIDVFDNTAYSTTTSSGAIIITNDNILIEGGTWGLGSGASVASWQGSIVVEAGSATIKGAKFIETWGGISGHEVQNGTKVCTFLRIESCEFDGCSHNTYLADIENFEFVNNHSHDSLRDGLRTYRNMQNLLVTGNHIYNNGSGIVGQSQDGIDLFFGGKRCIVTGNYIYGNFSKGIDIKRGLASAGETVFGEKFIIANNHIYDNGGPGIELEQSLSPAEYNEDTQIISNQIYDNAGRGIFANYTDRLMISSNVIYGNETNGVRADNSDNVTITGNTVYDNIGVGVFVNSTTTNAYVYGNMVFGTSAAVQTTGIFHEGTGYCRDNDLRGATSLDISSSKTDGSLGGGIIRARVQDVAALQYIGTLDRRAQVVGAKLTVAANTDVTFVIGKRTSAGAFGGALYTGTSETMAANTAKQLTAGVWDTSDNRMSADELLYITVSSATTTFGMGIIEIEFIS